MRSSFRLVPKSPGHSQALHRDLSNGCLSAHLRSYWARTRFAVMLHLESHCSGIASRDLQIPFAKCANQIQQLRLSGVVSSDDNVNWLNRIKTCPVSLETAMPLEANRVSNHLLWSYRSIASSASARPGSGACITPESNSTAHTRASRVAPL